METRQLSPLSVRAAADGVVEAFLPMFSRDPDAFGTLWRPGVFDEHLSSHKPKIVGWDHNSERRFGVVTDWRREETGYRIFAQFNLDTIDGREGFAAVKFDLENGAPDDWSFRFEPVETELVDGTPEFVRAKVFEFSPVLVGAIAETATVGARSAEEIANAPIVDVTEEGADSDLTRAIDRLAEAAPEISDELTAVALLEERGLRIGKKLSAKSLSALRDVVTILGDLIAWAESDGGGAEDEDENETESAGDGDDRSSNDGEDDDAIRAALAILDEYSAVKEEGR